MNKNTELSIITVWIETGLQQKKKNQTGIGPLQKHLEINVFMSATYNQRGYFN